MPAYRLYVLDRASHIRSSEIIEAGTDQEAMRAARKLLNGSSGELWLAENKVCTFGRGITKEAPDF